MSKLILTNNSDSFNTSIYRYEQAELKLSKLQNDSSALLAVFNKRIKQQENFYSNDSNDYVVVVGTIIYKRKSGVNALKLLLDDFDGNVIDIKKKCLGIYTICIKKNNEIFLFNDYYAVYDVYYNIDSKDYFFTNDLSNVAISRSITKHCQFEVYRECFDLFSFYKNTPYHSIYKLEGNEYFKITQTDCKKYTINRDSYLIRNEFISEEHSLNFLKKELLDISKIISANFKSIDLNCTGGLDSRLVLTVLNEHNNVRLLYGKGDSVLAPTCLEDYKVVQHLSEKFNMPLYEMDWTDPEINEGVDYKHQYKIFKKYGFQNLLYTANRNIFTEYEGKIPNYPDFIEYGYFLESLRLREWAENLGRDFFTLNEFVDNYYLKPRAKNEYLKNYDDYRKYVIKEFIEIVE
ncbi:MAG: hypothetical protein N4A49_06405 [Marinifilaceae bacterium]|jgi:asparagine synthetase B (glutamine-hydrolysing)|nr:hypothetical protein [Marinifilaceae bacterium]